MTLPGFHEEVYDYIMVSSDGSYGLAKAVREKLSEGYTPYGSPFAVVNGVDNFSAMILYQAMIKKEVLE